MPVPGVFRAAAEPEAPRQTTDANARETAAVRATRPNLVWSADFMSDALHAGHRFGTFNVLSREALRIEVDT